MEVWEILLCVVVYPLAFGGIIYVSMYYRYTSIVCDNSEKIKDLLSINRNTSFKSINTEYSYNIVCETRTKYNNLSTDDYFGEVAYENEDFFKQLVESLEMNQKMYDDYIWKTECLMSTITVEKCKSLKVSLAGFLKYENKIFASSILKKPTTDVLISCRVEYFSPKRRRHSSKRQKYSLQDLKKRLLELEEKRAGKQNVERTRTKATENNYRKTTK